MLEKAYDVVELLKKQEGLLEVDTYLNDGFINWDVKCEFVGGNLTEQFSLPEETYSRGDIFSKDIGGKILLELKLLKWQAGIQELSRLSQKEIRKTGERLRAES
jgi:hypothetical protein